jgi:arylsulfatase
MTIDVLPTLAEVAGAAGPADLDGRSVWALWSGRADEYKPQEAYYLYYHVNQLHGVVSWPWKLLFPHKSRSMADKPRAVGGIPGKYTTVEFKEAQLFHLEKDVSETRNVLGEVSERNPEVLERLRALAGRARVRMGDALEGTLTGTASRPVGRVPGP